MNQYLIARGEIQLGFAGGNRSQLLQKSDQGIYRTFFDTITKTVQICEKVGDEGTPLDEIGRELSLLTKTRRQTSSEYEIEPMKAELGCKIGRIKRPVESFGSQIYAYEETVQTQKIYSDRLRQFIHIYEKLVNFSRLVDLEQPNLSVYGSETRYLLLMSCLEVEALFKMLMFEDFQNTKGNIFKYWRIAGVARLPEYTLRFPEFPGVSPVTPFLDWSGDGSLSYAPLKWYQAYNSAKHNATEGNAVATLKFAIEAIAACFILLSANSLSPDFTTKRLSSYFGQIFVLERSPEWSLGEHYWYVAPQPLRFTAIC